MVKKRSVPPRLHESMCGTEQTGPDRATILKFYRYQPLQEHALDIGTAVDEVWNGAEVR